MILTAKKARRTKKHFMFLFSVNFLVVGSRENDEDCIARLFILFESS